MAKKYLNLPTATINERLAEIPGIQETLETKASSADLTTLSIKVEDLESQLEGVEQLLASI